MSLPRPTRRTTWPLAAALALHALIAAVPGAAPRRRPPPAVRIRIVQALPRPRRAAASAVRRRPAPPRPGGTAASSAPRSRPQPAPPPTTAAPPPPGSGPRQAYEALLPGAAYEQSTHDGTSPPGAPPGPPSTGQWVVADELLGKLDIPLIFRSSGATVKALAKIVRHPAGAAGWRFDSVDGDPVLRAVLFEALRDPLNRRTVLDLFRQLRNDEVLVSLRQRTVVTDLATAPYEEAVRIVGNKVVVERTLYVSAAAAAGGAAADLATLLTITLPDKDAERARRRDRTHLERLQTSPAFHSPLRGRDP